MDSIVGSKSKYITICVSLILIMILSACEKYIDADIAGEKAGKIIIECLSNDDKETLKSMFSEKERNRKELDLEIDKAMKFFDGKAVDGWKVQGGSGGAAYDYGKITYKEANPYIYPLKTNTGKVYAIYGYSYIVNKKEPDKVGLNAITIIEAPDDNYTDYSNAPEVTIGTP